MLDINADINYNNTTNSPAEIITRIKNAIKTFNTTYLQRFDTALRISKLSTAINNTDTSIISNQIVAHIYKPFQPTLGVNQAIQVNMSNPLQPGTITSSRFVVNDGMIYEFTDYNPNVKSFERTADLENYIVLNKNPVIYIKEITNNNSSVYTAVGSIDYTTGIISIRNINIIKFIDSVGIEIRAKPLNTDIYANFNNIVEIEEGSINIKAIPIK